MAYTNRFVLWTENSDSSAKALAYELLSFQLCDQKPLFTSVVLYVHNDTSKWKAKC